MSFRIQPYEQLQSFANAALPCLLRDEALNNLQLGIIYRNLVDNSMPFELMATVHSHDDEVVAVLTRNSGFNLVCSQLPTAAIEPTAEALVELAPNLVGVVGPAPSAPLLASAIARRGGLSTQLHARLGVFALSQLIAPVPATGTFRCASLESLALVIDWISLFHKEVLHDSPFSKTLFESRVRDGNVFFWCDDSGNPASMAIIVRESPNGSVIGFVYTPPHLRGRGFASNCVAHTCVAVLRRKQFCCLFADLNNATSIGLYTRLGFVFLGDSLETRFQPAMP